ncbi:DNA-binding SARP family transcriptional activator [Kribbella sp. VKM Ac-2527]|uniref:DNA-binding SARP family transcriptional activator n=1 Tax=Kribbella caucasensis TaxID=2512215 RepID=A0A4R6JJ29_9ACTN|nr:BTAD domain-containing putative transcriptional regulator [Kribbella sp. VKM Ac-2527]TDO35627.1 DNA-binding SARP family transcriptional activator [Kribbella sp. VKM Ac-2527]
MTDGGLARPQIAVGLLGNVGLHIDGRPVELGGERVRTLLAVLALSAGDSLPTTVIAERVWGDDPPANIGPSLHTLMTRLRRAVGVDLVSTGSAGYSLRIDPDDVDALRFSRLLRSAAQAVDAEHEHALIVEAMSLWMGQPFEGIRSAWLESGEAPRLVEQYLAAVERRVDLRVDDRQYGEVLAELRELTNAYPLRESLWVRFLRVLAQCGRTAEALELYESVRLRIADELGVDPGVELRALHAELLAGDRPRPVRKIVPNQLPADVPGFTGRKSVMAELDRILAGRGPESLVTLVLHGPGGVGKTSLAVHWSHQAAADFPDGTLFVDLGGYGPGEPVDPSVALGYLLHALGVPAARIPAEVDGRSALLRSTLAGQRVLLVLDNARNAEQVRPLLPGTGAVVLVASRSRLRGLVAREGAQQLPVEQLSTADARTLLSERLGETGESKLLDQLADSCNHLPLALVIAAEQIARRSGAGLTGLAELVEELDEQHLDAFDTGDDVATDLRAVFSWSYRALDDEAARLFRMLSLYPFRRFAPSAVAALTGRDERAATRLLRRLTDLHLTVETGPNRFQLHDLLRAYAAERFGETDTPEDARVAWERLLDWAVHSAHAARRVLGEPNRLKYLAEPLPDTVPESFADQQAALTWFDVELRGLMAMVKEGAARGLHAGAASLGLLLWTHLGRLVSPDESIAIQQISAESGRLVGNRMIEALAHNQLGTSYGARGDLDRTETELTRALRAFEAIGAEAGIALVRGNLGFLYQLRGEYDESIRQQEIALEINRRGDDAHAESVVLNNLAMTYVESGRYDEARRTAVEGVRLSENLADRRALSYVRDTLGQAYVGLGEVELAAEQFEAAVVLNLELGSVAPAVNALVRMGQTWLGAGDRAAARTAWNRALELIDDHGLGILEPRRPEITALLEDL